jgi:hypothetical protein
MADGVYLGAADDKIPHPHQHCHPLISIVTPQAKKNEFVFGFLNVCASSSIPKVTKVTFRGWVGA